MVKFSYMLVGLCVFLFPNMLSAQDTTIYKSVEIMPEPAGGLIAYMHWIKNNISYSEEAYKNNVQGQLLVKFVVEKNGALSDIRVLDSLGYGIDEQVVKLLETSKLWNPGVQFGRVRRVWYQMPIHVDIQESSKKVDGRIGAFDTLRSTEEQSPDILDVRPEPPGGMPAFMQWISARYRYPTKAIDNDVSGTVEIEFIVEKDGSITNIKILKDIGYGTGQEAVRVIKASPKWSPGIKDGRPVRVRHQLPIKLNL